MDQGLPQQTSGTSYEPVCANPNPAVACASAPPVCEPEAEPEPGGCVRFCNASQRTRSRTLTRQWLEFPHRRSPNPKLTSCGGGGASHGGDLCKSALRVSVVAWQGGKPNSSSPPHTGLGPVVPLLAAALPGCRLLLQSSLHLKEDAVWGGSCGGSYSR